jgi:hypothetical protein
MKNNKDKILKKLRADRQDNLRILIKWSFKDLEELKDEYFQAYKSFSTDIIWERYSQVDEAIRIKIGNEEQAWDFLT